MTTKSTTLYTKQWVARLTLKGRGRWSVFRLGSGPKGHIFRNPYGNGWLGVTLAGKLVQGRTRKSAVHRLFEASA